MGKKIVITSVPQQMANGGWASQQGSMASGYALYTPWPVSARQHTALDPQYNMKSTLQPVPRELSDIEAEQGEQVVADFNQDGMPESMGVGGKRHSEGGTPLAVPDGAFVYSDTKKLRIKDPMVLKVFGGGKPKTPAELAKKYPLNEYKSMMDNPDTDPLTRSTAERMYANNTKKLEQVKMVQEAMKQDMGIPASPGQPMEEQQVIGRYGGNMPKYWGGGNKRMNPDGSIDHMVAGPTAARGKRKVQITSIPGDTTPMGVETDMTSLGTNDYWKNTGSPTPGNMQQGLQEPTLGTLGYTGMDATPAPINPQMVNVSPYTPTIPRGTNRANKMLTGIGDKMGNYRGMSADAMSDIALGLKALNTRKYTPWEPTVQAVYPEFIAESDQPVRNALSEVTNTITQGMYAGDPKTARAAAQGMQGQLLANAVQGIGQVSNRNAQGMNRYSEEIANITNQRLGQERERGKRLYDGNIIANQQYQNSLNNLMSEQAQLAQAKEKKASELAWINKTSPYFAVDNRGMPVFKSAEAQARYTNEVLNMRPGEGGGSGFKEWVEHYQNSGMDEEMAKDAAYKKITGMDKDPRKSVTTKEGNKTTKVTKRYGGLLAFLK